MGFEGLYKISNKGNLWSAHLNGLKKPSHKRLSNGKKGYLTTLLCDKYNKYIHRLVAEAFIPNPLGLPQINHKNEDKHDNRVENLEWCDAKYNSNYGTHNERLSKSLRESVGRRVIQYDLDGNRVREYDCTNAVEKYGFKRRPVIDSCNKRCKTYAGYVWRFEGCEFSLEERRPRHNCRVFVFKDEEKIDEFNSPIAAEKAYNVPCSRIRSSRDRGITELKQGEFTFKIIIND